MPLDLKLLLTLVISSFSAIITAQIAGAAGHRRLADHCMRAGWWLCVICLAGCVIDLLISIWIGRQ